MSIEWATHSGWEWNHSPKTSSGWPRGAFPQRYIPRPKYPPQWSSICGDGMWSGFCQMDSTFLEESLPCWLWQSHIVASKSPSGHLFSTCFLCWFLPHPEKSRRKWSGFQVFQVLPPKSRAFLKSGRVHCLAPKSCSGLRYLVERESTPAKPNPQGKFEKSKELAWAGMSWHELA